MGLISRISSRTYRDEMQGWVTLFCLPMVLVAHDGHDHSMTGDISDSDIQHLKDTMQLKKPIKDMTSEERQFYYFKQSDHNDDDMMDGLEMMQTLIKYEIEDATAFGEPIQNHPDEYWIKQIDRAIDVQDLNDDGMVDFIEFTHYRNKNKNKNKSKA